MFTATSFTYSCTRSLDRSLRIALVFAIAVSLPPRSHGDQIEMKQCSDHQDTRDIEVKRAEIKDLEVGKTFHVDVTVDSKKEFDSNPELKLDIFTSNKAKIPCVFGFGSCTYKLCGGTSVMEKLLSSPWDGKCPIKAQEYKKKVSFLLPALVKPFIGDGRLHLRGEMTNGGKLVACQELDVQVKM
uniref:ML domain containing protein n=1 Tax=Rhipicephalus appendiculatus TaxID=34631 RepID=A0A131Z4C5_RHIAP